MTDSRCQVAFADIRSAHARIAPHVHRTPVLTSRAIDAIAGCRLFFKCENFQRTGAFKARGAFNAVLSLTDQAAARGVVTHSSGNHAAALALAARERGVPAYIVMPHTAPAAKKAATLGYGAVVTECEPTLAARVAGAQAVRAATEAEYIPPFDDDRVIAGQGTCAVELIEDAGPFDALTAPIGGGGLFAGTAITCQALAPGMAVVGAEPELAGDAAAGFASGVRQPQMAPTSIADGLLTAMSERTFGVMRAHATAVVTVDEAAIVRAMRLVWERMKIIIEPSCAVPLAAILEGRWDAAGKRVGVILTGGNVDFDRLPW